MKAEYSKTEWFRGAIGCDGLVANYNVLEGQRSKFIYKLVRTILWLRIQMYKMTMMVECQQKAMT